MRAVTFLLHNVMSPHIPAKTTLTSRATMFCCSPETLLLSLTESDTLLRRWSWQSQQDSSHRTGNVSNASRNRSQRKNSYRDFWTDKLRQQNNHNNAILLLSRAIIYFPHWDKWLGHQSPGLAVWELDYCFINCATHSYYCLIALGRERGEKDFAISNRNLPEALSFCVTFLSS